MFRWRVFSGDYYRGYKENTKDCSQSFRKSFYFFDCSCLRLAWFVKDQIWVGKSVVLKTCDADPRWINNL
jgi:hypothetical protein